MDIDLFERRLADDEAVGRLLGQALGTQLQLAGTFLTRDVEYALLRQSQDSLQHQGRFADTRLTAYQHQRPLYQSTAQHAVQLGVVQVDAWFVCGLYLVQRHGFGFRRRDACLGPSGYGFLAHDFLDEGIPLPARRALSLPLGRLLSAVAAYVHGFFFGHIRTFKKIVASKIVQTGRSTKRKHSFRLFRPSLVWLYLASFSLSVVPIVDGHLLLFSVYMLSFPLFFRRTPPGPASVVVSVIDAVKILLLFVRSKIWSSVIAKNLLTKSCFCVNKTSSLVSSVENNVFALAGRRFLFVTLSLCIFMNGMHLVCE